MTLTKSITGAALAVLLSVSFPEPRPSLLAQSAPPAQTTVRVDPSLYSGMRWRSIGPDRGGRSIAAAGSAARPNEYYFGAVGGGVWKTTDFGHDLERRSATPTSARRRSAPSPSRRRIPTSSTPAWASPASAATSSRATASTRRATAARRWTARRAREHRSHQQDSRAPDQSRHRVTRRCWAIRTTRTPMRGVYPLARTAARPGSTSCSATTGAAPSTSRWIRRIPTSSTRRCGRSIARRGRWRAAGPAARCSSRPTAARRGPTSPRTPGCPSGLWGRVGVSVSGADSNRVYAIIENDNGGVFVSDDAGATWQRTNEDRNLRQRAFYYTHIYADPVDKDTVYVLNVQFFKSTDGGKTFPTQIRVAARRQPRPVDRAQRQQADGRGQRRRRQRFGQRRADLVGPGLIRPASSTTCSRPGTCRITSAARSRTTARRASAARTIPALVKAACRRSSTPSAAARAATSRPIPPTSTCSTPAATAAI